MSTTSNNPALHKAISILEYISNCSEPVSVKELIYTLGIPPASCYRMVNTLLEHNWVREEPSGGLRIAFGLAHVARAFSEIETRLRDLEPSLRGLAEDLQMSVKVSLREGYFASVALRAESAQLNAITSPIGSRIHLTVGSAAAVLLSWMPDCEVKQVIESAPDEVWQRQKPEHVWERIQQCRDSGICSDLGRYHPSIYAMSASLRLNDSLVVALTAVGWPGDFTGEKTDKVRVCLQQVVRDIEQSQ